MSDTPDLPTAPPPQPTQGPAGMTPEEMQMGMFCHLASLVGYVVPFGNILGPLILWLIKKDTMPFVDSEGKESVNFQISMTVYMLVSGVLMFFCIGLPMLIGFAVFDIIVVVLACIESSKGRPYRYPLCIRFIQ